MEQYKINTAFKGFTVDQKVSRDELAKAIDIPMAISENDIIFALAMADIISFIMPEKFEKDIFIPDGSTAGLSQKSFKAVYSLMDQQAMMYSSDIDGLPDAMIDELTDMGYQPVFVEKKESNPYMKFPDGTRLYAGDKVYRLIHRYKYNTLLWSVIVLSNDFLESPKNEDSSVESTHFFKSINDLNGFIASLPKAPIDSEQKSIRAVEKKLFSVMDIDRLAKNCKANNGSTFAKMFVDSLVDAAGVESYTI